MAYTAVPAVVKANRWSNGKGKFRNPGAPKPLNGFRWNYITIISCGYDHTCKSMRCDNVGGVGEHVTCHLFGFSVYLFEIFLLYSSVLAEPVPVDRFSTPIRHTTCFNFNQILPSDKDQQNSLRWWSRHA